MGKTKPAMCWSTTSTRAIARALIGQLCAVLPWERDLTADVLTSRRYSSRTN
jgi:hypothetical protein